MLKRKDLLGLIDASASEITEILDLAQEFKNRIKKGEIHHSFRFIFFCLIRSFRAARQNDEQPQNHA